MENIRELFAKKWVPEKGVKTDTLLHNAVTLHSILDMRREPGVTELIASLKVILQAEKAKYAGSSLRAELWNCPTPFRLVV